MHHLGKETTIKKQLILIVFVLVTTAVIITRFLPRAPFGTSDFRAYWSASYLLVRSQNFADSELLLNIEQEMTGRQQEYAIQTWNPPWLLLYLIPYTFFPFKQAVWLWLITNIALIFMSSILIWQLAARTSTGQQHHRFIPILVFTFSPVLITLLTGQVNTFVLLGLTAFLIFESQQKDAQAGASLVLTLVKPHLVYIALPLIFLTMIRQRRWRFLTGFAATLTVLTIIIFILRPTVLSDYANNLANSRLLQWATPTIGGILSATWGWNWARYLGVAVLPLAALWWWLYTKKFSTDMLSLICLSLVLGLPTAPFGWGYDSLVLIIPLLVTIAWLVDGRFSKRQTRILTLILVTANALSLYQRSIGTSEALYFWLPLFVALFYGGCYLLQTPPDTNYQEQPLQA
jgi:hypothetical protein